MIDVDEWGDDFGLRAEFLNEFADAFDGEFGESGVEGFFEALDSFGADAEFGGSLAERVGFPVCGFNNKGVSVEIHFGIFAAHDSG